MSDDVTSSYLSHNTPSDAQLLEAMKLAESGDHHDPSIQYSPLGDVTVQADTVEMSSKRLTEEDLTPEEKAQLAAERAGMSAGDYVKDIGSSAIQGVVNAGTEISHTAGSIAQGVTNLASDVAEKMGYAIDSVVPYQDNPNATEDFIKAHLPSKDGITNAVNEATPRITDADWEAIGLPATRTFVGGVAKSTTQFLTGFVPALRGMKALSGINTFTKTVAGSGAAGVAATAAAFNPYEARISNWAASFDSPKVTKAVADWLKADDNDPEAMARVKMAIEGVMVGKVAGTALEVTKGMTTKALEAMNLYKKAQVVFKEERGMTPPKQTTAAYMTDPATGAHVQVDLKGAKAPRMTADTASVVMPDDSVLKDYATSYLDGDFEGMAYKASGLVNTKYINSDGDIRDLVEGLAQVRDAAVGKHYSGWQQAAMQAGKLGEDAVANYGARVKDLDSYVVKAAQARNIVAYKARELANIASAHPSEATLAEFQQAWKILNVLDAHVSQNASEVARALAIMRRPSNTGGIVGAIKDAAGKALGADGATDWDKLAKMVADLPDSTAMLNMVKASKLPNWKDAAVELWVNALFSPLTLAKNVTATMLSQGNSVVERYLGAARSQFGGSGELTFREANQYALGFAKAAPEAFKVMWQAWKTEAPVLSGKANEFEEVLRPHAIAGASFGITPDSHTVMQWLGKGIDLFGHAVRGIPGGTRSLLASDEGMKTFIYRAELNALAQREATKAGLKAGSPEFADKVKAVLDGAVTKDPKDAYYGIHLSAMDAAERGTFTEALGERGTKLLGAIRQYPLSYVPLPFIKTPTNLLKYLGRRTPGLSAFSDYMEGELKAGGARADLAGSQIAMGSLYLAAGASLAGSGLLHGEVTTNWTIARNMKALGLSKSSLEDPNTGKQYDIGSFDGSPLSMLLFAGTVQETVDAYIEHNKDRLSDDEMADEVLKIMALPIMAAAKYGTNRSWATGTATILDAVNNGGLDQYAQRAMGQMIPFGNTLKWFNTQSEIDPFARETDNALEEIRSKIPKFSRDLPPKPTLLGDPTEQKQYAMLGLMPVYSTTPPDHPVLQELARLQKLDTEKVVMGGVPKTLGDVKLDGVESWNFMQFMRYIKDANGKDMVESLGDLMETSDYKEANDFQKEQILTKVYNERKKLAERAMQWDASAFYAGQERPHKEAFRLYDYKRRNSITEKIGNEKALKMRNKFGGLPDGMEIKDFISSYNDEILKQDLSSIIK